MCAGRSRRHLRDVVLMTAGTRNAQDQVLDACLHTGQFRPVASASSTFCVAKLVLWAAPTIPNWAELAADVYAK